MSATRKAQARVHLALRILALGRRGRTQTQLGPEIASVLKVNKQLCLLEALVFQPSHHHAAPTRLVSTRVFWSGREATWYSLT